MSNKHNLILLKEGQPWHIWRWGSLWPICNPNKEGPRDPLMPDCPRFKTSIHHDFDKEPVRCVGGVEHSEGRRRSNY